VITCACQPAISAERLAAFTELTPGMRALTFDVLGPSRAKNVSQEAQWDGVVRAAQAYAAGATLLPWFVLAGSLGWGKTHLATAILNWRIDHPDDGPPGKYVNCPDFLAALRQGIDEGGFETTLTLYREVPLLLLDDLGAEYQRRRGAEVSWADEQIYRVLDYRYREKMGTIITTNIELARVAPRLRDRLQDRALVAAFGLNLPSYRTGEIL
jgi:DNA replication protein DnaC